MQCVKGVKNHCLFMAVDELSISTQSYLPQKGLFLRAKHLLLEAQTFIHGNLVGDQKKSGKVSWNKPNRPPRHKWAADIYPGEPTALYP
jgi:hypothetical protein